jgi:TolA-binding protein
MLPEEYITLLSELNEQIRQLNARVKELEQRNEELETENKRLKELLHEQGAAKGAKVPVFHENYSVEQQTNKKSKRGRGATGRRNQVDEVSLVGCEMDVYPDGVAKRPCSEQRQQYAWRLMVAIAIKSPSPALPTTPLSRHFGN